MWTVLVVEATTRTFFKLETWEFEWKFFFFTYFLCVPILEIGQSQLPSARLDCVIGLRYTQTFLKVKTWCFAWKFFISHIFYLFWGEILKKINPPHKLAKMKTCCITYLIFFYFFKTSSSLSISESLLTVLISSYKSVKTLTCRL